MLDGATLPDDPTQLRAMLVTVAAELAERDQRIADLEAASGDAKAEIERLNAITDAFQRHRFGARSKRIDLDQLVLALALEVTDTSFRRVPAGLDSVAKPGNASVRKANQRSLPAHLERIEQLVDIEQQACDGCGGALHVMGEM